MRNVLLSSVAGLVALAAGPAMACLTCEPQPDTCITCQGGSIELYGVATGAGVSITNVDAPAPSEHFDIATEGAHVAEGESHVDIGFGLDGTLTGGASASQRNYAGLQVQFSSSGLSPQHVVTTGGTAAEAFAGVYAGPDISSAGQ